MVWLADARAPQGLRLYVIGDVHGCLDALKGVHRAIRTDLARRPVADWRIVHLGDYVDRGAESRGVIDFLVAAMAEDARVLCLRGNHDQMFAQSITGDRRAVDLWLMNGGAETLESYGVALPCFLDAVRARTPALDIPVRHRKFLDGLVNSLWLGDYYLVHAGIDPRRGLDAQVPEDQLWIRDPFLTSDRQFEAVVVHGHTPAGRVAVRPNRIGIDTGAVYGGSLTCLVLEDNLKGLLSGAGVAPLPRDRGSQARSTRNW
jgi:serine/threonine protein phosphatase 1